MGLNPFRGIKTIASYRKGCVEKRIGWEEGGRDGGGGGKMGWGEINQHKILSSYLLMNFNTSARKCIKIIEYSEKIPLPLPHLPGIYQLQKENVCVTHLFHQR
jgi:hypothetical protein